MTEGIEPFLDNKKLIEKITKIEQLSQDSHSLKSECTNINMLKNTNLTIINRELTQKTSNANKVKNVNNINILSNDNKIEQFNFFHLKIFTQKN